ncbi:MAG: hypothetical protein WBD95_03225 [Xanthobacteraceae bacterium]
MTFFDEDVPFREYMRGFDLVTSLIDVWAYSCHIIDGQPLASEYAVGLDQSKRGPLRESVHPWELDILAREIVLNSGQRPTYSLRWWNDLAAAVNFVRRLDEVAFLQSKSPETDVLLELHRIAHRQFPWQIGGGANPMVRAYKVFGQKTIDAIIDREMGMTARQFLQLGMALSGHFIKKWGLSIKQDYRVLGITTESSNAFFRRITSTLEDLRTETAKRQSYNHDWLYAWNPLEATPLIAFDPAFPDRVLCPIPRYLLRRTSAGIFFDLVKAADFDNPFGNSFQNYIGEVIRAFCMTPSFNVLGEEPYYVGKKKMHGVDWVVSDKTAHLFIESKTKRLTVGAKTMADAVALDKDLSVMAEAIVQHYKNIQRALDGRTGWRPDGLPIYPMILTLEDWFFLSPRVDEMLERHLRQKLAEAEIPDSVFNDVPYTIASSHEFELAIQVVAQLDIYRVMSKKTANNQRTWPLSSFVMNEFEEQTRRA